MAQGSSWWVGLPREQFAQEARKHETRDVPPTARPTWRAQPVRDQPLRAAPQPADVFAVPKAAQ